MEKTFNERNFLVVPDVHNNVELLEEVDKQAKRLGVTNLLFLGDYFNCFGECDNHDLYMSTLDRLNDLNDKYNCLFLIGNHDLAYVTDSNYRNNYHAAQARTRQACHSFFNALRKQGRLRFTYDMDGILYSHAGVKSLAKWEEISNDMSDEALVDAFKSLEDNASHLIGRPIEWINDCDVPRLQVFGHTPFETIKTFNYRYYGCDTWSIDYTLSDAMSTREIIDYRTSRIKAGVKPTVQGDKMLLQVIAGSLNKIPVKNF